MEELIKIQTELKAPKNLYNSFGKYKYRNAEGIMEAVKPLLKKYNCYLTLCDDIYMIGDRYYLRATATFVNKEGKSVVVTALAREDDNKKGMDGSQITGTASSYARKYALNGLFLIDDTKDADTDEYKVESEAKAKKANAQPSNELPQKLKDGLQKAAYEDAFRLINAAANRDELMKVWNTYVNLQKDNTFYQAVKHKGEKLKS